MGYSFSLIPGRHDVVRDGCNLTGHEMMYVRMILIEAGAIEDDKYMSPVSPKPGLERTPETFPASMFESNDGQYVDAERAAFVARRLRRAVELGVVSDMLSFLDDAPETEYVRAWVEEFAEFNELAARYGGYTVR